MESLLQSLQDFHRHFENKGPTVVLVKANDCIFGGYTGQNWDSGMYGNLISFPVYDQSY